MSLFEPVLLKMRGSLQEGAFTQNMHSKGGVSGTSARCLTTSLIETSPNRRISPHPSATGGDLPCYISPREKLLPGSKALKTSQAKCQARSASPDTPRQHVGRMFPHCHRAQHTFRTHHSTQSTRDTRPRHPSTVWASVKISRMTQKGVHVSRRRRGRKHTGPSPTQSCQGGKPKPLTPQIPLRTQSLKPQIFHSHN